MFLLIYHARRGRSHRNSVEAVCAIERRDTHFLLLFFWGLCERLRCAQIKG